MIDHTTPKVCPNCRKDLTPYLQIQPGMDFCLECKHPLMLIAGKYRLLRVLGEGGFGMVYYAEHVGLSRDPERVIKFLRTELFDQPSLVERFLTEVQITSVLSQKNDHIVRVYDDFGETPKLGFYYVMEYLEGQPLTEFVKNSKKLPNLRWTLMVFEQLCDAMQAAHEEGIVHRDLKPDNILLIERRKNPYFLKVLDFGISKPLDQRSAGQKKTQGILGTPLYLAPEQAANRTIDARTDIFAMGVILFEMLTGENPWVPEERKESISLLEVITAKLMTANVPSPRQIRPDLDIPEALSRIVCKALSSEPGQRYSSAEVFWAAIAESHPELIGGNAGSSPALYPPFSPPVPPADPRSTRQLRPPPSPPQIAQAVAAEEQDLPSIDFVAEMSPSAQDRLKSPSSALLNPFNTPEKLANEGSREAQTPAKKSEEIDPLGDTAFPSEGKLELLTPSINPFGHTTDLPEASENSKASKQGPAAKKASSAKAVAEEDEADSTIEQSSPHAMLPAALATVEEDVSLDMVSPFEAIPVRGASSSQRPTAPLGTRPPKASPPRSFGRDTEPDPMVVPAHLLSASYASSKPLSPPVSSAPPVSPISPSRKTVSAALQDESSALSKESSKSLRLALLLSGIVAILLLLRFGLPLFLPSSQKTSEAPLQDGSTSSVSPRRASFLGLTDAGRLPDASSSSASLLPEGAATSEGTASEGAPSSSESEERPENAAFPAPKRSFGTKPPSRPRRVRPSPPLPQAIYIPPRPSPPPPAPRPKAACKDGEIFLKPQPFFPSLSIEVPSGVPVRRQAEGFCLPRRPIKVLLMSPGIEECEFSLPTESLHLRVFLKETGHPIYGVRKYCLTP